MTNAADLIPGNRWALVLAGGDGTRLQDLTRKIAGTAIPKQYCRLLGDQSLLEATLKRIRSFTPGERTAVVVNENHLPVGWQQLRSLPAENVLIQPRNRDTGPGLLYSLLHLAHRDPAGIVAVFPSDHYIGNEDGFMRSVHAASRVVARCPEKIVVLGIRPERPDCGLGYIMPGERLSDDAEETGYDVRWFQEKPEEAAAVMLLAQGGLWNSFVMVFRISRMLELIHCTMPDEFSQMHATHADPSARARAYAAMTPWNFSSRLLARIPEHLVVLPVEDVHWSDWGTPEAIHRSLIGWAVPPPWFLNQAAAKSALPTA